MPIYEYECAKCGYTLEAIQKISAAALTTCPACHKRSLRKQVSASAFHLKGSGWYVTDFKDKPKDIAAKEKTGEGTTISKEQGKSGEGSTTAKEPVKEDTKTTAPAKTEPAKKSEPAATE